MIFILKRPELNQQIFSALNLEGFRTGRHTLYDKDGGELSKRWVRGLWMAYVSPSFEPPAELAVAYDDKECVRGALTFSESDIPFRDLTTVCAEFPRGWSDPVTNIIQNVNLFDLNGGMSLDGIGYFLQVDTNACEVALDFSMPQTPAMIDLESALFEAAQEIVRSSNGVQENKFLNIWARYLKRKSRQSPDGNTR
jgi:hypothetical protein